MLHNVKCPHFQLVCLLNIPKHTCPIPCPCFQMTRGHSRSQRRNSRQAVWLREGRAARRGTRSAVPLPRGPAPDPIHFTSFHQGLGGGGSYYFKWCCRKGFIHDIQRVSSNDPAVPGIIIIMIYHGISTNFSSFGPQPGARRRSSKAHHKPAGHGVLALLPGIGQNHPKSRSPRFR